MPDPLALTPSPSPNRRIVGYDVARALAVFGMVVVNFKIAMGAEHDGPQWLLSAVELLNGRAAALFVILAGIGVSLMTQKGRLACDPERIARDRKSLFKRALFLFVVGLLYTPIWPADILHFYGVYLTVGAFAIAWSSRRLAWTSGGLIALAVLLIFLLDYERGWNWDTLTYTDFWTPDGMVRHLFFNGIHPVVPWLAFLLVGMIVGRLDLRDAQMRRRMMRWGAVEALLGTSPMPPMPLYLIAATGTACVVIAACVAVGERWGERAWLRPFVATGQLALTLYVAHVIVGMGVLDELGRLDNQTLPFSLAASAVFCAGSVLFAHLWRKRFARGPLEAVMRKLTS